MYLLCLHSMVSQYAQARIYRHTTYVRSYILKASATYVRTYSVRDEQSNREAYRWCTYVLWSHLLKSVMSGQILLISWCPYVCNRPLIVCYVCYIVLMHHVTHWEGYNFILAYLLLLRLLKHMVVVGIVFLLR